MPDFLKKTTDRLFAYFKALEKGQKARFFVLFTLFIVLLIAASVLFNQKSYTVLYSGMDTGDAGEVLSKLSEMGVASKAQGNDTILVESSQADSVRMQLAAEGYPKSGFNFDIFKSASGLGATDMEKRVYYQFQLQENLSKVIRKLDKVEDAVVNISLAKESAFVLSSDEKPASAAVLLKLKSGAVISSGEVRAIAELVSKSVSGLNVDDVRIIDSNMTLYTSVRSEEYEAVGTQFELQQSIKTSLQRQLINLLAPVFGSGNVLAEVNVLLNFDKQQTETVEFSPPIAGSEQGLAVSIQELAETIRGSSASGVPGLDSSGGTSITTTYPELEDEASVYKKVSREANLELNETRTQITNSQGQIRDLSVAIVIDSSQIEDDYSDNVLSLVSNAIGVERARISVEMLPFKKLETSEGGEFQEAFSTQKELLKLTSSASTTRLIILAATVLLLVGLLVGALFSLKRKGPIPVYDVNLEAVRPVGYEAGTAAGEEQPPILTEKEDSSLTQLEQYIQKRPESVAQLLRNWLSETRFVKVYFSHKFISIKSMKQLIHSPKIK